MRSPTDAQASAARICDSIKQQLRCDFPFMTTPALNALAQRCTANLTVGISKQVPAMEAAKERSSFMSLSPELRNRIYDLLIMPKRGESGVRDSRAICVQQAVVHVYDSDADDDEAKKTYGSIVKRWINPPAITRVSRQVRAESLSMYYGLNEFVAYNEDPEKMAGDYTPLFDACCWLSRIGPANAALVKRFIVAMSRQREMGWDEVIEWLAPSAFGMDEDVVTIRRQGVDGSGDSHVTEESMQETDESEEDSEDSEDSD